jgi:hypothetical protein
MPTTDSAARYYGLVLGQVVRVTNKPPLNAAVSPGPEEVFCRVVQRVDVYSLDEILGEDEGPP